MRLIHWASKGVHRIPGFVFAIINSILIATIVTVGGSALYKNINTIKMLSYQNHFLLKQVSLNIQMMVKKSQNHYILQLMIHMVKLNLMIQNYLKNIFLKILPLLKDKDISCIEIILSIVLVLSLKYTLLQILLFK